MERAVQHSLPETATLATTETQTETLTPVPLPRKGPVRQTGVQQVTADLTNEPEKVFLLDFQRSRGRTLICSSGLPGIA